VGWYESLGGGSANGVIKKKDRESVYSRLEGYTLITRIGEIFHHGLKKMADIELRGPVTRLN